MTTETNKRSANVVIAGDEVYSGIDMDDVRYTGPLTHAFVIQFDSVEAMREAILRGYVEFDFMRDYKS